MSNAMTPASIDTGHVPVEDDIAAFLHGNRVATRAELGSRARIPSIAARPEHATDVERSAHRLAGTPREVCVSIEVIRTGAELEELAARTELDRLLSRDGGDS